jgi:formate dehydrogenase maturation protein FdhE
MSIVRSMPARVDLYDSCKKYLKTLDSRETERMIYSPLEQISSLVLDYKAKEMEYEFGSGYQPP